MSIENESERPTPAPGDEEGLPGAGTGLAPRAEEALIPEGAADESKALTPEDSAFVADALDDLTSMNPKQQSEAERFALDFLAKIARLKGVKIEREAFLRQELVKLGASEEQLGRALASTPVQAGFGIDALDALADACIAFETKKSAAFSFASGLPGGPAMAATIPADIAQYYVHAFRVMQKLAYLYGWQDFFGDVDRTDDETLGRFALFFGVMLGVGGASASLSSFAAQVARPALHKQIAKQTLTKTSWYPVLKQSLRLIGVKVTKDSFARSVTKLVPVAGGVISGGMTLVSLRHQSARLKARLRELPPPGVDAQEYTAALTGASDPEENPGKAGRAAAAIGSAAANTLDRARSAFDEAGEGAKGAASEVSGRLRGAAHALFGKEHSAD